MYLLDTNICIAILKDNPFAVNQFRCKYQDCYLSTLANLKSFELALPQFEFDAKAAEEFGKIQGELKKIGKPTGQLDALIASVARSRQDILVTDNIRHFINIPNLRLGNWLR